MNECLHHAETLDQIIDKLAPKSPEGVGAFLGFVRTIPPEQLVGDRLAQAKLHGVLSEFGNVPGVHRPIVLATWTAERKAEGYAFLLADEERVYFFGDGFPGIVPKAREEHRHRGEASYDLLPSDCLRDEDMISPQAYGGIVHFTKPLQRVSREKGSRAERFNYKTNEWEKIDVFNQEGINGNGSLIP